MTGGLIQLVTTGIQDSPIIGNPEITFFKNVYRQHTLFSLFPNERYLNAYSFEKEGTKVLEKNGDLLYNQYFKLEIPYFKIINNINTQSIISNPININMLDVTYLSSNCIVLYCGPNWYIVPENLFKISSFQNTMSNINSTLLQPKLLPDYIKLSDLGQYVQLIQIQDNPISSIISILSVNSSFWEQFWLNFLSTSNDIDLSNNLVTINSAYTVLYSQLKYQMYNNYYINNIVKRYKNLFNFQYNTDTKNVDGTIVYKTEVERYYEYLNLLDSNSIELEQSFDMDLVYDYCNQDITIFNSYINNVLPNNSLIILFILNMLYSDPSNLFTIWSKYYISNMNAIRSNTPIVNNNNIGIEWINNIKKMLLNKSNLSIIDNMILDEFTRLYKDTQQNIVNQFANLKLNDLRMMYIKLKVIADRFTKVPNFQLNFNNYFYITNYNENIETLYNNDNYNNLKIEGENNYSSLSTTQLQEDETKNLTPVNIETVYGLIAEDIIDLNVKSLNLTQSLVSPFVLWRNCVMTRLYKKFLENNTNVFKNPGLTDYDSTRNMTLYHNITPTNFYTLDDFRNSYYEMFYKNSFMGTVPVAGNDFQQLKEDIYNISVNNLFTTTFTNQHKNFQQLSIQNTYNYTYFSSLEPFDNNNIINDTMPVIYDSSNTRLLVRYDNFYDDNSIIQLYINSINYKYTSITYTSFTIKNMNHLYLAFNGIKLRSVQNGMKVQLIVDYNTQLPIVLFNNYDSDVLNTYPSMQVSRYDLLRKSSDNVIEYNNIVNNGMNILVDSSIINNNNILVIEYINNNNIIPPTTNEMYNITFTNINSTDTSLIIDEGYHYYAISYETQEGESELSILKSVVIESNMYVILNNIPISLNSNVINRNIYRSMANDNKMYLLYKITDNITTKYVDNIQDIKLGVEIQNNTSNRTNILPKISNKSIRTPINISSSGSYYVITDINTNTTITLPTDLINIKSIYIESYGGNYEIINSSDCTFDNYDNSLSKMKITLNNELVTNNYLYYLVNPANILDYTKLSQSNQFIPFNNTPILSLVPNGILPSDTFTYYFTFYSSSSSIESTPLLPAPTITCSSGNNINITNLPIITDNNFDTIIIYRNVPDISGNTNYYYLTQLTAPFPSNYIDNNISSNILDETYKYSNFLYITKPINTNTINKPSYLSVKYKIGEGNIEPGKYYYLVTYMNTDTNEETPPSTYDTITNNNYIKITNTSNNTVHITIPISSDTRVNTRRIYRTKANLDNQSITNFFLLTEVLNNTDTLFIDTMNDSSLGTTNPTHKNINYINYNILKVPMNNFVVNMNSFISHSTDYKYINDKKISDLGDTLFNNSFITMVNTNSDTSFNSSFLVKDSFTTPYINFYNIKFKLNSSSIIKLNNINVNFLLPISSQQYFNLSSNDNYYSLNTLNYTKSLINNSMIKQKTFNPSFDEFNLPIKYIYEERHYSDIYIDIMINNFNKILISNTDYNTLTQLLDSTNKLYINIITETLNNSTLFGNTSNYILGNINTVNNIIDKSTIAKINYPLLEFNNSDYLWYSHNMLRLVDDNNILSDISNIKESYTIYDSSGIINIISPVYEYYNSNKKISSDLSTYLTDIGTFFTNQIQFINNNSNYTNISNPNNYDEMYLSYDEIIKDINTNFFTYSGNSSITLLHPIVDDNIYQINIVKTGQEITNTMFNVNNTNTIVVDDNVIIDSNEDIASNNYYDTQLSQVNRNSYRNDKFNYLGLVYINDGSISYTDSYTGGPLSIDSYLKCDDNKIYSISYVANDMGRNQILADMSNFIIMNPYLLTFNTISPIIPLTFNKLDSTQYAYIINIKFISNGDITGNKPTDGYTLQTNFMFDDMIISGYYIYSNTNNVITNTFYLITDKTFTILYPNINYMASISNYGSWVKSDTILSSNIVTYSPINYSSNLITTNSGDIYQYIDSDDEINNIDCMNIINMPMYNKSYYNLSNTPKNFTFNIFIKIGNPNNNSITNSTVTYLELPPAVVVNNLLYYYYYQYNSTKVLDQTPNTNYILLVNSNNNVMTQLGDINLLPNGSYHTWIYPQNYINTISMPILSDITISVDTSGNINFSAVPNIPCYSYYLFSDGNKSIIYYYTTGTSIKGNYNFTGTITISLVDNTLLDTHMKQLIYNYNSSTCTENIITKNVKINAKNNNFSFDSYDYLYYQSQYYTNYFDVLSVTNGYIPSIVEFTDTLNATLTLNGSKETFVNMLLQDNSGNTIYMPIILKQYCGLTSGPMIRFTCNGTVYTRSFVVINTSLSINNTIGVISFPDEDDYTNSYSSVSPYITIDGSGNIILSSDFQYNNTFGLYLWKIDWLRTNTITNNISYYSIYFWTLFTNNISLINSYLSTGSIYEPYYLSSDNTLTIPNYFNSINLLSSSPSIVSKDSNNLILNIPSYQTNIGYKYYTDTRDVTSKYDVHGTTINFNQTKLCLNFNSILNVKPDIEYYSIYNLTSNDINFSIINSTILSNSNYFIITYNLGENADTNILTVFKSELINNIYTISNIDYTLINNVSIYYSIHLPFYIYNSFTLLPIINKIYQICSTNFMLYLEMGEIILIDGNYYKVNGLLVQNKNYEIELLSKTTINSINYVHNGYYTLGNYLRKNNNIVKPLSYINTMQYSKTNTITSFAGNTNCVTVLDSSNNQLYFQGTTKVDSDGNVINPTIIINDSCIFPESSLQVNLYFSQDNNMNNRLYMYDNFVKIKLLDKLYFNDTYYKVIDIRDNEIFLDTPLTDITLSQGKFNTFTLPYQPFEIIYLTIDSSGNITTNVTIYNNDTILFDSSVTNYLTQYMVINNKISWTAPMNGSFTGYVRLWRTSYYSNFENSMTVPLNNITYKLNNMHPIDLVFTIDQSGTRLKLYNDSRILDNFIFFYMQPIKLLGTFNYVKKIYSEQSIYYIELINPILIDPSFYNTNIIVTFSPVFNNLYQYYTYYKFRYNFGIQTNMYDLSTILTTKLNNCYRFVLNNDDIIIFDQNNLLNTPLSVNYSQSVDKSVNFLLFQYNNLYSIYAENQLFYDNCNINNTDGLFYNFDTLTGSYHILLEVTSNMNYTHLVKIIYPNRIKFYSTVSFSSTFYLDKIIPIKISKNGEFTYSNFTLIQARNMLENNSNMVQIINKYSIRFVGTPTIVNNMYQQTIVFIGSKIINNNTVLDTIVPYITNTIYFDINDKTSYTLYYNTNTSQYYILSPNYISTKVTTIYTIRNNYITNITKPNKTLGPKLTDAPSLKYYVDTQINPYEYIKTKIIVNRINIDEINQYNYKLVNHKFDASLNINDDIRINDMIQQLTLISTNNNSFTTTYPIYIDNVELTQNDMLVDIFTKMLVNINNVYNDDRLYTNVKQLRIKILNNCYINDYIIYNNIKPWTIWSLLNPSRVVSKLTSLINLLYLKWDENIIQITNDSTVSFSYITNDELNFLTNFLTVINTSSIAMTNYNLMKRIETLVFNNILLWLSQPDFFLDVTTNINNLLRYNGFDTASFNGNNIVFSSDPDQSYFTSDTNNYYYGQPSNYISNEFTYDSTKNIVYRSATAYEGISIQVVNWINKTVPKYPDDIFGVNINMLLKYLYQLGSQLTLLLNNMTNQLNNTPDYVYNDPLKFIINKVYYNNKTNKVISSLNPTFTDSLLYTYQIGNKANYIISGLQYPSNFTIIQFGKNSVGSYFGWENNNIEKNFSNLTIYNPNELIPLSITKTLITKPIYPYTITFPNNVIIANVNYNVYYLNGINISNTINMVAPILYPNQLKFYSSYNIKPTETLIIKQTKTYTINTTNNLGYLYNVTFPSNINISLVDSIYIRSYYLTINSIDTSNNIMNIIVPFNNSEMSNLFNMNINDYFEARNSIGIKSVTIDSSGNQILNFYNPKFQYIANNTLLQTPSNLYNLNYNSEINQYYIMGPMIDSYNVTVITLILASNIVETNFVVYNYLLSDNLISTDTFPVHNNNLIAMDFKLYDSNNDFSLTPSQVYTVGNNMIQFYMTYKDALVINNTMINNTNIYYYNYTKIDGITYNPNVIIYLYDKEIDDININLGTNSIYIPNNDTLKKTATKIYNNTDYIYMLNNITYDDSEYLSNNIGIIVNNSWEIYNFSLDGSGNIIITLPTNINITNSSTDLDHVVNYFYSINNISVIVDTNTINNNMLKISWTGQLPTTLIFTQFSIVPSPDLQILTQATNYDWSNIIQTERLGEEKMNSIVSIIPQQEYLYQINYIIPAANSGSTKVYIYDTSGSDINTNNGIYIPTIDTSNKTSIYFNQDLSSNTTLFTIVNNYDSTNLFNHMSFTQKNTWYVKIQNFNNNIITITLPSDFIVNTSSQYFYTLDDITIDKTTFVFQTGTLSFIYSKNIDIGQDVSFCQYYVETIIGNINKPQLSKKVQITYSNPYQYIDPKFYIVPYMSNGVEFDNNLYNISVKTIPSGISTYYMGGYDVSNTLLLIYSNGVNINCKIFDTLCDSSGNVYNYIVSTNNTIDMTQTYMYTLDDKEFVSVQNITFWQNALQLATFYKQTSINTVHVFMDLSVNNYTYNNTNNFNDKPSKYYIIASTGYTVTNNYETQVFVQNQNMTTVSTLLNNNITQTSEVNWDNPFRLFEYIRFYIGDQLIEEINENVFNINYYLYSTEEKRKQIDNMIKYRLNTTGWELYLPLNFWFTNKPGLSIPLVALPHIDLRIVYKLNSVRYAITNNIQPSIITANNTKSTSTYSFTINPMVKISLVSETILLDTLERKLFGTFSHEYVIENYKKYSDQYVNGMSQISLPKRFRGLIKDIHFITRPIVGDMMNKNTSYQIVNNNYDYRYQLYTTALGYYNTFIINNIYTSQEQQSYAKYIEIVKNVINELNNYNMSNTMTQQSSQYARINSLISNFSSYTIYNMALLQYLMFYEDAFMPKLPDYRRIYILSIYLQSEYSDKQTITEYSPIDSLTVRINGVELIAAQNWLYFNSAVPFTKFKNSLPIGYNTYTFSLYPTEDQYSGHLNFTNFDDISLLVTSNSMISNQSYLIQTQIKEYNILRIMSGMGSLGWIN